MLRVTLDTNIYVSALEFGGVGARLLGMARAGMIGIDVSDAILDELVAVLRDDFAWEAYRLHFAREQLAKLGNLVTRRKHRCHQGRPGRQPHPGMRAGGWVGVHRHKR